MEKSLDYDYIFKYILIGDASVGKSTLLNMFVNETFISESNPTMGVQFATKKMMINGKIIKVQIWDTVIKLIRRQDSSLLEQLPELIIRMQLELFQFMT